MTMRDTDRAAREPPLVLTKLQPPVQRGDHLARAGLLARVDQGLTHPFLLVSAPAGYGKSSLLAGWASAQSEWNIGWLSLDPEDSDSVRLFSYLIAGVSQNIDFQATADEIGQIADLGSGAPVLADLINAVAASGGRLVTILDDLHLVSDPDAHQLVAWLIDHLPNNWRIIAATRQDPPFPLASWRATAGLAELREDDLVFSAADAGDLLAVTYGIGLERTLVQRLVERTEGWGAALCLAGLSLQKSPDPVRFVEDFAGNDRNVVDYLATEVLAVLSPKEQRFLMETAFLDELSPALCQEVTADPSAPYLLHRLEERNVFLIAMDDRREWYRYHHLFSDWLRHRAIAELGDEGANTTNRRAARWHTAVGRRSRAIEYLIRSGQVDEAAEQVLDLSFEYYNIGRRRTLVDWIERLPSNALERWPALGIAMAWAATASGRVRDVEDYLDRAEAGIAELGDDGVRASHTVELMLGRAILSHMYGNATLALDLATEAIDMRADPALGTGMGQADWDGTWALVAAAAGDLRGARTVFEALEKPANEHETSGILASGWLALLDWMDGRDELARTRARRALALSTRMFDSYNLTSVRALGALAAVADGEEAATAATQLRQVAARTDSPIYAPFTQAIEAEALRRAGMIEEANDQLTAAQRAVRTLPEPGLIGLIIELVRRRLQGRASPAPDSLSEREIAVLRALAGPLTRREIGRELHLSLNTIKTYTRTAYQKLGVSTRNEAVEAARRLGLI